MNFTPKLINRFIYIALLLFPCSVFAQDLVKYVQPMAGTAIATTASALKHGQAADTRFANTIPSVTVPFAITQ